MGYRFNMQVPCVCFIVYLELDPILAIVLLWKGKWGFRCIEYTIFGEVDYCLYYGFPLRELVA